MPKTRTPETGGPTGGPLGVGRARGRSKFSYTAARNDALRDTKTHNRGISGVVSTRRVHEALRAISYRIGAARSPVPSARRACRGARRLRDVRCSSHCAATAADTHAPAPATRTRRAGRAHTLSSRLRATHIYSYSNPRSYHWRAIARPHLFLLRIRSRWRTSQSSRRAHSTSHSVCCATSPSPSVPLDVPVGCAPRGG